MTIKHLDKTPKINPTVYIAPTATICGVVKIGKKSCITLEFVKKTFGEIPGGFISPTLF